MYGKIFDEIYQSTITNYDGDTIYVFISMIVLSDDEGFINYSTPALARTIRKDIEIVKVALENLLSPDLMIMMVGESLQYQSLLTVKTIEAGGL